MDIGRKFIASGGSGTLKNEKNETIAEGDLKDVDEALTIKGKSGAAFIHQAKGDPFADDAFSKEEVKEFASKEKGTVKFAHGKIIEASDASYKS